MSTSRPKKLAARPHVVYVLRDAADAALYAGYTSNLNGRLLQHFNDERFGHLINRVEVESEHPDRESAQLRETDVIWDLEPPFNIKDNPAPVRERLAREIFRLAFGDDAAEAIESDFDRKLRTVLEYLGDDVFGARESLLMRNWLVVYRDCCKPLPTLVAVPA